LTEIISVRFRDFGKAYYFNPNGLTVNKGEFVVVETAKGVEYGECVRSNHKIDDNLVIQPLRSVLRVATEADNRSAEVCKEKEKEALAYCQQKIIDFGLEMKLVSVEYGFEGNKVLFFFTSDGRVDFRELVKDLAGMFRARIELRQIGVRDEAKMLGGMGVCGKQYCCSQFLTEFSPVSIKMAKTQGLSLNPTKISGACGRLMCCLKYEEAAYEDLVRKAPKIGAFVETPNGKGSVVNINILRGNAKVRLEDGNDTTLKTFTFEELDVLGGKGRRAEYISARDEGRLEEAGFQASAPPMNNRTEQLYDASSLNKQSTNIQHKTQPFRNEPRTDTFSRSERTQRFDNSTRTSNINASDNDPDDYAQPLKEHTLRHENRNKSMDVITKDRKYHNKRRKNRGK
jgi:cell fate regulator YaaT (PSP1 superfamily)